MSRKRTALEGSIMNTPTTSELDHDTIQHLQKLTQANIDSVNGFREAAERVEDRQVAELFRCLATDRAQFADQLSQYVAINNEQPPTEGSWLASLHRVWLDLRGRLSGGDASGILAEAERGEDYIKSAYEKALKETAGSPVNDVLLHQYRVVKEGHDRVREMRGSR
ncbi:MAG: PA2169 family four-helix-bundle protein [Acidimicrobiales bacterium]|nr:PA2169 family four-helix-bundle protein [Acidimicrobiales bacterium]